MGCSWRFGKLETGLPTRYYFDRTDVAFEHLLPTTTQTSVTVAPVSPTTDDPCGGVPHGVSPP